MCVCVNNDGGVANALQAERLPHNQQFVVMGNRRNTRSGGCGYAGTRGRWGPRGRRKPTIDDNQVARAGCVDCGLDGVVGGILPVHVSGSLAAHRDSDRVDGPAAVSRGDHQFTAQGWGLGCGLTRLLNVAQRQGRHGASQNKVAASADRSHITDGHRGTSPKTIVASDELLVIRKDSGRGARIRIVEYRLVAQSSDGNRVADCAYPRPRTVTVHSQDCWGSIRVVAIRRVVTLSKGGDRHYRRV